MNWYSAVRGSGADGSCYETEVLNGWFSSETPDQAITATLGAGTCRNTNLPGYNYFICSECGAKVYLGEDTFSYCPKCGRKVEG